MTDLLNKINLFLNEITYQRKQAMHKGKGKYKPLCVDCDSTPAVKGSRYCASCAKSRRKKSDKTNEETKSMRDYQLTVVYYNKDKQRKEVDVNLGPKASPEDYVAYVEKNYQVSPQGIVRVEDRNGKVLWRYTEKKTRKKVSESMSESSEPEFDRIHEYLVKKGFNYSARTTQGIYRNVKTKQQFTVHDADGSWGYSRLDGVGILKQGKGLVGIKKIVETA